MGSISASINLFFNSSFNKHRYLKLCLEVFYDSIHINKCGYLAEITVLNCPHLCVCVSPVISESRFSDNRTARIIGFDHPKIVLSLSGHAGTEKKTGIVGGRERGPTVKSCVMFVVGVKQWAGNLTMTGPSAHCHKRLFNAGSTFKTLAKL